MDPSRPSRPLPAPRGTIVALLALALVFTLLNAVKPVHIDDTFIYRVAEQITKRPWNPYGFEIFWLQWPQPAYEELTPPVLPYWWALGLAWFGERPFVWKLWLFPFPVLFAFSLHAILRRLARGVELPLVCVTLISPVFLPGFNLMQDIPAHALALGALALYLRAADRGSPRWAVVAGLVAGLALQTKYTAIAVLAAILIHALLNRRWREGGVTVVLGMALFAAWETFMTLLYGQGMFLRQLGAGVFEFYRVARTGLLVPLLRILGATAPVLGLIALLGAGLAPRVVLVLAGVVLAAFLALLGYPVQDWIDPALGALVCVGLAWAAARALRARGGGDGAAFARSSAGRFLVGWLLAELGVYLVATPFPAVRRGMGIVLAATVLCGRLLAGPASDRSRRRALVWLVALGSALGLLYYGVDLREALDQKRAVERAERVIGNEAKDATVWFVGHWGFQFYAERSGMRPVVPDRSRLRAGDWLVVPEGVHRQEIRLPTANVELVRSLDFSDWPPLVTGFGYYSGSTPLAHRAGPRFEVAVYRVIRDVVPRTDWPVSEVARWTRAAGGRTGAAAVPALLRELRGEDPAARRLAAESLAGLGAQAAEAMQALADSLRDVDPSVRYWSAVALGRIGTPARPVRPALEAALRDPDGEVRRAAGDALRRLSTAPESRD